MRRLLVSYRIELGKFQRWLVRAHIAKQTGKSKTNGKRAARGRVNSAALVVTRVIHERPGNAAGQDIRLRVNNRNECVRVSLSIDLGSLSGGLSDLIREADARKLSKWSLAIKLRKRRAGQHRSTVGFAREKVLVTGV